MEGPPPVVGTTQRLEVLVQLETACDTLAGVEVILQPGNATDFVQLSATVWVPEPPCAALAGTASWVVSIPGRSDDNLRVVVTDLNSPGGGLRLTYDRAHCGAAIECLCRANTPAGTVPENGACRTDCNCANGLPCLGFFGFGGPAWICARPCNDLLDCSDGERCLVNVADGLTRSCMATPIVCDAQEPCPAGFDCVSDAQTFRCADRRVAEAGTPCACDGDCPLGQHCTVGAPGGPTCETWCKRPAECPAHSPAFACTRSRCVP